MYSHYPLGLIRQSAELSTGTEMIVEPARLRLPVHVMRAQSEEILDEAASDRQGSVEFHSLREYQTGEDARRVHAVKSASVGTLVRKITQGERARSATVVLDLRRAPGRDPRAGGRRFEWSLCATASLVDEMMRRGAKLTCLVIGETDRTWAVETDAEAADFLAFLAGARSCAHRSLGAAALGDLRRGPCYWVPAGGFRAAHDREALGTSILVSEREDS